jgi:hypothetical protein
MRFHGPADPIRRFERVRRGSSTGPFPGSTDLASLEVDPPRSLICKPTCGSSGSPQRLLPACFQSWSLDSISLSSLANREARESSFPDGAPLQSSFASTPRAPPFGDTLHLPRFLPSSRLHDRASTSRGASHSPLRSVLRFSQPLDGFFRALACGLVSSRCHVQGSSGSGASPPPQPPFLIGRSLPPCRSSIFAHRPKPAATSDAPRLRGFHPRQDAFHSLGYSPHEHSLPSSGFSPPGLRVSPFGTSLPSADPLMTFSNETFACALASSSGLQRLPASRFGVLVSSPTDLPELFEPSIQLPVPPKRSEASR